MFDIEAERKRLCDWAAGHYGIPREDVHWANSGICYDTVSVLTEKSANKIAEQVKGRTVNGGYFHGMQLGGITHIPSDGFERVERWDVMC
jgi:hypothetical protein